MQSQAVGTASLKDSRLRANGPTEEAGMKGNIIDLVEIVVGIVILGAAFYKADLLIALTGVVLLAAGLIQYMRSRFYKKNSN
jgi:uncharacterized membrane protein HdeD (DUF308 family)